MKRLILIILMLPSICLSREVRIAVLDSGLSITSGVKLCQPTLDLTNTSAASEFAAHGDRVTHTISDGLENYCIISIKVWTESKKNYLTKGIYEAIRLHADIINISGGGEGSSPHEESAIKYAYFKHIIVIAAAGNDSKSLETCYYYPACYPSVVAIGNQQSYSNYGSKVDYYMKGVPNPYGNALFNGTSQSTALFTHELAKRMGKE